MWADGGKDDRHEFGRSMNKDERFQQANLVRTLEEGAVKPNVEEFRRW